MPASIAVILSADRSQILLVKRRDVPVWVLPGGGIDPGESPEEAIIRESLEETGVHVRITRKVAEYIPVNRLTSFTYFFECEVESGTPKATEESRETAFFPLNDLPKNFFMIHKDWLDDALANHAFVLQKFLTSVSYFTVFKYLLASPRDVLRFAFTRLTN